jgi:hypothetical protein
VLARLVERIGPGGQGGGLSLALGAFLDGIPEQLVEVRPRRRPGDSARLRRRRWALDRYWLI